jgi:hypothetical protein
MTEHDRSIRGPVEGGMDLPRILRAATLDEILSSSPESRRLRLQLIEGLEAAADVADPPRLPEFPPGAEISTSDGQAVSVAELIAVGRSETRRSIEQDIADKHDESLEAALEVEEFRRFVLGFVLGHPY